MDPSRRQLVSRLADFRLSTVLGRFHARRVRHHTKLRVVFDIGLYEEELTGVVGLLQEASSQFCPGSSVVVHSMLYSSVASSNGGVVSRIDLHFYTCSGELSS